MDNDDLQNWCFKNGIIITTEMRHEPECKLPTHYCTVSKQEGDEVLDFQMSSGPFPRQALKEACEKLSKSLSIPLPKTDYE